MRKCMKLGASALAAVAIVAGSASAASAYGKDYKHDYPEDKGPYICGNYSNEGVDAEGDYSDAKQFGYGPNINCQVGENPINIVNNNGDVEDDSYDGLLPELPVVTP